MESLSSNVKIAIPQLIQQIQSTSPDSDSRKAPKFFPYIETYGRPHECEENLLMNKTIKFRESYIHNRTLRYMEPTFSYRQVLAKLKNDILQSKKPEKKNKTKSLERENQKLKEMITKTEMIIARESQPSARVSRGFKTKSHFPNGLAKITRNKIKSESYGSVSPDILRVTNYAFGTPKKKETRRKVDNLTYYREVVVTQETHASDYIYIRPRYPNHSKVIRENPVLKCDAISNTDLSNNL